MYLIKTNALDVLVLYTSVARCVIKTAPMLRASSLNFVELLKPDLKYLFLSCAPFRKRFYTGCQHSKYFSKYF